MSSDDLAHHPLIKGNLQTSALPELSFAKILDREMRAMNDLDPTTCDSGLFAELIGATLPHCLQRTVLHYTRLARCSDPPLAKQTLFSKSTFSFSGAPGRRDRDFPQGLHRHSCAESPL